MSERCEVCQNTYDKPIHVTMGGEKHVFDSFECAIHRLAPRCAHCGCMIIGHGMEAGGRFFCCKHCATSEGERGMRDRAHAAGALTGGPRALGEASEDEEDEAAHDEAVATERDAYRRTDAPGGNHPVGVPLGASAGAALGAVAGIPGGPVGVVAGTVAGGVMGSIAGHAKLDKVPQKSSTPRSRGKRAGAARPMAR